MTDSVDVDSNEAQHLDEIVGALSEQGWTADEICARVRSTLLLMEAIEDNA